VDRLFAIWQAINPGNYVVPETNATGTWTESSNTQEDVNTPLKPFQSDPTGNFWTPTDVVKTSTFQYAYPETQEWKFQTNASYQANVRTAINNLYSGSSPSTLFGNQLVALPITRHQVAANKAKATTSVAPKVTTEQKENIPAPKANPPAHQELKRDLPKSSGK
jgi:tyrosinase